MKFFLILSVLCVISAAPSADEVMSLPLLNVTIDWKHYSGYLSVGSLKHLHYWLVESQNDPDNDPLVLWLNGGPGCSSLDGMLYENGPFHVNEDGSVIYLNEYAWNQMANVIYLEAPVGVGFSYSENQQDYYTDDAQTADDNYVALQDFFANKFPEWQGKEFYVTGESYGGIYVPTLVKRIIEGNEGGHGLKINLQAFAVGNGLMSDRINDDSVVFFAYYHGLIGQALFDALKRSCCVNAAMDHTCNFHDPTDPTCQSLVNTAGQLIYGSGVNIYAIYLPCVKATDARMVRAWDNLFRPLHLNLGTKGLQRHLADEANGDSDGGNGTANLGTVPPCLDANGGTAYLNRADVQAALHIASGLPSWAICSDVLHYNRSMSETTFDLYPMLLSNTRALIYNGDTDMACNFLGDEWGVDAMNRTRVEARRPWHLDGQVAGFVESYEQITFLTVRGSGHMVPQWRAPQAFKMFTNFIKGAPY